MASEEQEKDAQAAIIEKQQVDEQMQIVGAEMNLITQKIMAQVGKLQREALSADDMGKKVAAFRECTAFTASYLKIARRIYSMLEAFHSSQQDKEPT